MNNKYVYGAIGLVVVGFLFVMFTKPATPSDETQRSPVGEQPGATGTLDGIDNPYVSIGGERSYHINVPLAATSSVVCSIANPFTATSTVQFPIRILIRGNGLGSQTLYVSTSTTNAASSTEAWTGGLATGSGQSAFALFGNLATTTAATNPASTGDANILPGANSVGISNYILGPTEKLNVRVASSTPGVFASYFSGTCSAVVVKI